MLTPERAQLEALLFATDNPLTLARIAELLVMPVGRVDRELELLEEQYRNEGHSLFVSREGSAIRLRTRPEFAQLLISVRGEPAKITRPALEVLAIIVMQKTATRSEIDRLRGVDSDSVVNSLQARGLIEEAGREETPGRAAFFRVTDLFLELFGVTKLTDLIEEYQTTFRDDATKEPETVAEQSQNSAELPEPSTPVDLETPMTDSEHPPEPIIETDRIDSESETTERE